MTYFLVKTDSGTYSISDFAKEKVTIWDGVRNPQAVKALQAMRKGDKVLIYHSQNELSLRGLAEVIRPVGPDPKDAKSWLVELKLLKQFKEPFITLRDIKASGKFKDFALVKQSRLSVMEVPSSVVKWLKQSKLPV